MISIPYNVPQEVLNKYPDYVVKVETDVAGEKSFNVKATNGAFDILLNDSIPEDMPISFKITIPSLWSPSDLMNSPDTRTLGIDIILDNQSF